MRFQLCILRIVENWQFNASEQPTATSSLLFLTQRMRGATQPLEV